MIKIWEADATGSSEDLPALFQIVKIYLKRDLKTIFGSMLSQTTI